jgi:hypothetical protein
MTDGSVPDRVVLELSPREAMTVFLALRQYMPYWSSDLQLESVAEQLEDIRHDVDDVIGKLRSAALPASG